MCCDLRELPACSEKIMVIGMNPLVVLELPLEVVDNGVDSASGMTGREIKVSAGD